MLYLEDYLEMIEHLPQELRDRFTEMREMDLQVQNSMDSLDERVKKFFQSAKQSTADQQKEECTKICGEYHRALEDADGKVHIANQIYDMVERYLRKLDQELQKFKIELEADNAGITEVLEKRSLALDNTSHNSHAAQSASSITPSRQGEKRRAPGSHHSHHPEKKLMMDKLHAPEPLIRTNPVTPNALAPPARVASPLSRASSADSTRSNEVLSSQLGLGSQALAAAASQAIAATQQMQQGRRSASLKASYEAIAVQNLAAREFTLGSRDIGSLTPTTGVSAPLSTTNAQNNSLSNSISALLEAPIATPTSRKHSKKIRPSNQNSSANSAAHHLLDASDGVAVNQTSAEETSVLAAGTPAAQTPGTTEWQADPNEPRYCICNQISYGDMVACDNSDCPYEWFHYPCVNVTQIPRGKWYCPPCTASMKRRTKQR